MKGIPLGDGALVMAADDNVATALDDLEAGREFSLADAGRDRGDANGDADEDAAPALAVEPTTVTLTEDVEFGHKFALEPIAAGEQIRKYGEVVGEATADIAPGEWVHTHNVVSTRGQPDREQAPPAGAGEGDA